MRKFNKKYWRCRFKPFNLSEEAMNELFDLAKKISHSTIFCRYKIMLDIEKLLMVFDGEIPTKERLQILEDQFVVGGM